ncbi:MAG: zinc ribbon domain-containing protein [Acidobacteria bacterium]|nr:zinc ribbon domain-containing protein [Acidobacteriota bacterium]
MPIYEYECQKCGTHLEKRQSISEEPLKICENCGGELVKKISLSGFQFKGAGWYVTDYAGKNGKSGEKPVSEKSSGGESTTPADTASKSSTETSSVPKADKSASSSSKDKN